MKKREIYIISNPFVRDYELFYLTYNKKTNKIEFNGKELNNSSYNLDDIIIMWDGKDHDYYSAHSKQFIDVYRSNSDKPEEGYIFVGKEDCDDLRYYHKRKGVL